MSKGTNQKIAPWELNNTRALAIRTLERVQDGAYSNLQLNQIIKESNLEPRDIQLLTTIVYGVIQRRMTLEFWLKPFVKEPKLLDAWVRELLYTAIFQLAFLDKVPKHAIFDETIKLAKRRGHDGIRKFVTGVLHAIDRQGLADFATIADPIERLSIEASLPAWLIQTMSNELGWEKTVTIAQSINTAPAQSARVNLAVTTVELASERLVAEGFTVEKSQVTPEGLILHGGHVASSETFNDGWVTLQDESAMLMVPSLQVEPGDLVLDAAAAPGGKTTQIARYLSKAAGGQATALDIHAHKVDLIKANAERLKVADRVKPVLLDARKVDEQFADETFDRILVDAPCSGFGLLRRKPEIRYGKSMADSENLQKIQLAILDAVAPKLKAGGRMVYGTCTILKNENEDVIDQFLASHSDFKLVPTYTEFSLNASDGRGMVHMFPDDFASDGFFIATLEKQA
ncbi:RNA methyltransferase [Weissella oryzae SG25]|uniref:16S rRNA (cytosine(967)-C(5))-methyltransferase n=1 Tax=Weissella oryzae (strain DSM 25784 / JCM 18191 / LMG 30913 / SG25) TaxID=1329250 RepID=A0A069CS66_WEIOS|nr:16S rRNA (cytosine(967)-C(5))-methyltransferase RsmB [Weissella oryzae]GAK30660.1 RNA methyltransferase [Weissella oryzae SG25]